MAGKAGDKALKVRANPKGPHYQIYWEGGGELPFELSGLYTTISQAEMAIFTFLKSKEKSASAKG